MSVFSQSLCLVNRVIVATLAVSGAADRLFGSSSPIAHVAAAGQPVAFVELVGMALAKAAGAAFILCWQAGSDCRALPRWIAARMPNRQPGRRRLGAGRHMTTPASALRRLEIRRLSHAKVGGCGMSANI